MEHKELSKTVQERQLQVIRPRHRALMRKLLGGKSTTEAAEELGLCRERAYIIVKSPLFVQEMEKMRADLNKEFIESQAKQELSDPTRKELSESTLEAAQALKEALASKDVNAVIRAAANILDRTGYGKEEKVKTEILVEPSQGLLNALRREIPEEEDVIDTTADSEDAAVITR